MQRRQEAGLLQPRDLGVKLGCQFINASSASLRGLQDYIAQTQKRARLLTL